MELIIYFATCFTKKLQLLNNWNTRRRHLTTNCTMTRTSKARISYLLGTGESVISKANLPGWGPSIALRLGWPPSQHTHTGPNRVPCGTPCGTLWFTCGISHTTWDPCGSLINFTEIQRWWRVWNPPIPQLRCDTVVIVQIQWLSGWMGSRGHPNPLNF